MPQRQLTVHGTPHVLDARPDRLDLRDRLYQPPTLTLPPQHPAARDVAQRLGGPVRAGLVLDQGTEGACTGFGLAAVINHLLWQRASDAGTAALRAFRPVSPHMLYDLARFYDEWPGQDYDGSSCRGAMKGWHKHGACAAALWTQSIHTAPPGTQAQVYRPDAAWPQDAATRPVGVYYRIDRRSVTDLQTAIFHVGAVYVSATVHAGWRLAPGRRRTAALSHDVLPRIGHTARTPAEGAHAFALVGYNEDGFVVQNSWGTGWGASGFAVLTYEDWVAHGLDAWVCTLGVPQRVHGDAGTLQATRTRRAAGASLVTGDKPLPVRPVAAAAQPWSTERAYLHSIVAGNDGIVDTGRPDVADAQLHVTDVAVTRVQQWLQQAQPAVPRVAVYAHGGLNSEAGAIERARVLGPYFLGNGIYPLFVCWKTGIWEVVGQELEDRFGTGPEEARLATGVLSEARDRLVEALAHGPLRWAWRQMKSNAMMAGAPGAAVDLLAGALAELQRRVPGLEVHLVGHSAGAFVMGHLMAEAALPAPASLTLYAPACPLDFALDQIAHAAPAGRTWLHLLTDAAERDDTVGSQLVYGKSLLYLVSRGFEDERKTPLAGLQRCLDASLTAPDDDVWTPRWWPLVQQWRAWVAALPPQADGQPACELSATTVVDASGQARPAEHGTFDNDAVVVTRTLNRMLGQLPGAALPLPVEDLDF